MYFISSDKNMKRIFILFLLLFTMGVSSLMSQTTSELRVMTKDELDASILVPLQFISETEKTLMPPCGANAANDNFANAQTLVVNGGNVGGTVCGTLEAGEKWGCVTTPNMSVWYKFVATATTHYVQATYLSGTCYFGCVIYGNLSGVPTNTCQADGPGSQYPISCQSGSGGPVTQLHQLTNLTIGSTYYIQITGNNACANFTSFNIQVTTANPGGAITNRPPINACSTASPGCYFPSPPTVPTVTAGCTSYSLTGAGYNANSIWQATFQYTNSATVSNVSLQAIITSNCGAGNVAWFNWRLYDCSCNLIGCGTLSNLTVAGLGCGTCYRFEYIMELANCSSFTTIWPYQNIPAVPIPCTVLPLNLLYFNANVNKTSNDVSLEWETVSEKNIKSFRIERSTDGVNFNPIVSGVYAVGSGYKYNFTDRTVAEKQMYYYKLVAVNNAGTDEFERTIVLAAQIKDRDIKLIPNPVASSLNIELNETKTYSSVDIYNTLGQKVKSIIPEMQANKFTVDVSDLSKGIYFVEVITSDNEVISKKLIKE